MKTLLLLLFPLITGLALAEEPTQLHFVTGLPGSLENSAVADGHAYCSWCWTFPVRPNPLKWPCFLCPAMDAVSPWTAGTPTCSSGTWVWS